MVILFSGNLSTLSINFSINLSVFSANFSVTLETETLKIKSSIWKERSAILMNLGNSIASIAMRLLIIILWNPIHSVLEE